MLGDSTKLFSVCCLGYCHRHYLEDAIKSIYDIGYDSIEIIVVDDGSSDGSVELLEELRDSIPLKMKIISQKNTGNVGLNFNTAYRAASGELVAFLSLDDVYNPGVMLKQLAMMNSDSKLAFVASSKTVSIDDAGYVTDKADQLPLYSNPCNSIEDLLELEYSAFGSFYIQSAVFRKEVVDAVGVFDEDMTGDDIVLRTKVFRYIQENRSYRFAVLAENSFFYRLHGDNIHRNFARQLKIVTEYLDRYWPNRENPEMLVDWAYSFVSDHRFKDCIGFFSINARTANILANPRISSRLMASVRDEVSLYNRLARFLYSRSKLEGGRRKVVLLGFFAFEYSRKKKSRTSKHVGPPVHYSDYR